MLRARRQRAAFPLWCRSWAWSVPFCSRSRQNAVALPLSRHPSNTPGHRRHLLFTLRLSFVTPMSNSNSWSPVLWKRWQALLTVMRQLPNTPQPPALGSTAAWGALAASVLHSRPQRAGIFPPAAPLLGFAAGSCLGAQRCRSKHGHDPLCELSSDLPVGVGLPAGRGGICWAEIAWLLPSGFCRKQWLIVSAWKDTNPCSLFGEHCWYTFLFTK